MLSDARAHGKATLILRHQLFEAEYKGVFEPNNHLLALDQAGQPIPHTYLGRILNLDPETLPEAVREEPEDLDTGFLLYATPWHTNFQHFLTETFPKLEDYLEWVRVQGRSLPLLIPRFMMNGFVEELLQILGLTEALRLLESPAVYRVGTLISSSYVPNYDPPTAKMIAAFKRLNSASQPQCSAPGEEGARRIYLARDKAANLNRNNSNAGRMRVIANEAEIQQRLYGRGFQDVVMGNLGIPAKVQALAGAEYIVSPIGANLMNLLFLTPPLPKRIIILHSSYLSPHAIYFRDLFEAVYDARIAVELLEGPAEFESENSPYALDTEYVDSYLRSVCDPWSDRMFPPVSGSVPA